MSFTDKDLKRLKEVLERVDRPYQKIGTDTISFDSQDFTEWYDLTKALLARLEAAEAIHNHEHDLEFNNPKVLRCMLYSDNTCDKIVVLKKAWRKSKGE